MTLPRPPDSHGAEQYARLTSCWESLGVYLP